MGVPRHGPGRVLLASRHPGPDPGSAHRAAYASRHRVAVRRPLTQTQVCNVEREV